MIFSHTCKNCCNFLIHSLIALKFGTNKEHIKVNSGTEFGMNLISIQCVRSVDSHRKWLNFRHAPTGLTADENTLKIVVCMGELSQKCLLVVRKPKEFLLQSYRAKTK